MFQLLKKFLAWYTKNEYHCSCLLLEFFANYLLIERKKVIFCRFSFNLIQNNLTHFRKDPLNLKI